MMDNRILEIAHIVDTPLAGAIVSSALASPFNFEPNARELIRRAPGLCRV